MPIRTVAGSTTQSAAIEAARQRTLSALPPQIQQNPAVRRKFGLGDAVAVVAKPIARVLGLPPDCKPCEERRKALNAKLTLFGRRG